jgi:hypothetical protein
VIIGRTLRATLVVCLGAAWLGGLPISTVASAASAADAVRPITLLRELYSNEFGVRRPEGLSFSYDNPALVVVGPEADAGTKVVEVTPLEDELSTERVADLDPEGATLDPATDEPIDVSDIVDVTNPAGATFDPATGAKYVLDAATRTIYRTSADGGVTQIVLADAVVGRLQGLAFNPSDGLLYVATPDTNLLYAVDSSGAVRATYSLRDAHLQDLRAIVFAPSTDNTDPRGTYSLFLADAGTSGTSGRIAETTLVAVAAATPTASATLVKTILTSRLSPASPDPSGISYIPSLDRLWVTDGEVDETTGAGYHGVNMWGLSRAGAKVAQGTTVGWSNEPTGAGYDPSTNTMFVSDDDRHRINIDRPGTDGAFGTSDDSVTAYDTSSFGNNDTEGADFDTFTRHILTVDGAGREVYEISPGPNGRFESGASDDVRTHFDVGQYGATDPEGITSDPANHTILVVDSGSRAVYELSHSGSLLRSISISASNETKAAGLTLAPTTTTSGRQDLWIVDRGVDNDPQPSENDGKLYEMSYPSLSGTTNQAPTVNAGSDRTVTYPTTVTLSGTVTDDGLPNPPGATTKQWSQVSGPGTATFSAPTSTTTNVSFSAPGTYVLRLTANDSQLSSSDDVQVTESTTGGTTTTLDRAVAASSDDAEEWTNGTVNLTSTDLELTFDSSTTGNQIVGMRFPNMTVPPGATITRAYVQFEVDEVTTGTSVSLTVRGQKALNPATFTTATGNISARPRTTASVAWSPPAWPTVQVAGADQRTPDLSAVIREVIAQTGWTSGNAMAIIITGTGKRTAESLDGTRAPVLHVEYTT